jgi:hypothetical protein
MEATIEIKESEYEEVHLQSRRTFFGRLTSEPVPHGRKKEYTVGLTIIPSEEERAIILK